MLVLCSKAVLTGLKAYADKYGKLSDMSKRAVCCRITCTVNIGFTCYYFLLAAEFAFKRDAFLILFVKCFINLLSIIDVF